MKKFRVTIELGVVEIVVYAATSTDARQKALAKLNKKPAASYIATSFPYKQKQIHIEES